MHALTYVLGAGGDVSEQVILRCLPCRTYRTIQGCSPRQTDLWGQMRYSCVICFYFYQFRSLCDSGVLPAIRASSQDVSSTVNAASALHHVEKGKNCHTSFHSYKVIPSLESFCKDNTVEGDVGSKQS